MIVLNDIQLKNEAFIRIVSTTVQHSTVEYE